MRTRFAVLAVLALVGAGCNRDNDPRIEIDPAPTTTAVTTTIADRAATTVVAATGTTVVASRPAATPDAAANGLFDRWQKKDRSGASRFARQRAIDELFSHPDTGDVVYNDQGCEPQGGQFVCAWTYPGGALRMTVEDVPGGGFVVDLVTYSAD